MNLNSQQRRNRQNSSKIPISNCLEIVRTFPAMLTFPFFVNSSLSQVGTGSLRIANEMLILPFY